MTTTKTASGGNAPGLSGAKPTIDRRDLEAALGELKAIGHILRDLSHVAGDGAAIDSCVLNYLGKQIQFEREWIEQATGIKPAETPSEGSAAASAKAESSPDDDRTEIANLRRELGVLRGRLADINSRLEVAEGSAAA